jgi:hypothetical protein
VRERVQQHVPDTRTGASSTETWNINPVRFALQMTDNSRLDPKFGPMKPELALVELLPGDCTRGYLKYEVPQGQTPKAVIYAYTAGQPAARWNVE